MMKLAGGSQPGRPSQLATQSSKLSVSDTLFHYILSILTASKRTILFRSNAYITNAIKLYHASLASEIPSAQFDGRFLSVIIDSLETDHFFV